MPAESVPAGFFFQFGNHQFIEFVPRVPTARSGCAKLGTKGKDGKNAATCHAAHLSFRAQICPLNSLWVCGPERDIKGATLAG